MVSVTRLLWFSIHLFSHIYAEEYSRRGTVKWLEAERSLLIHLPTPDLHFWNQPDRIATHLPGAFIFNFTLTADNLTLLLNDEPILPRAHPHIPTPLRVHQTPESGTYFANRVCTNFSTAPVMDLDYYISTPDPTSGTSIWNTKYNPRVQIDILRANIPSYPGYSTPLSSNSQQQIWLYLEDLSPHPPDTLYSKIPLRIRDVKTDDRWFWEKRQGGDNYKALQDLKECNIWSWLCADIPEYPYYTHIYQMNFDQYGKKGSMRHFVTERWDRLVGFTGLQPAIALLALCINIVLSLVVYALFRAVKKVIDMYRARMQKVDEWLADEQLEDSLSSEEVWKEKVALEKGGEKMDIEEALLPPPYIQIETGKALDLVKS